MIRSCFVGVALIAMLSAACSNDAADRTSSAPGEGGGASGAANPPAATTPGASGTGEMRLSVAEQTFVQNAAQANQVEVEMARMGQDKSQNDEVKDFARQLEQDHSEALDDLRQVATRASVVLTQQSDAQRTSMSDRMGNVTGQKFDSQFISEMIDAHRKNIADFESQQASATGELKRFIDTTLPVMREHLQKAEELQTKITNSNQ